MTPLDHILALAAQLRSDMTTLANVTVKVRVNGGSATTYTNVSTPAITQNGDIAYGYELKIPANTYADGDVVEATWLYSATAYAYAVETIGPTAVDGAHYTAARGDKLDDLDATVSSRLATAGYTAPDNADVAAIKLKTDLIPAAGPADAAHFTNARGDKLDQIDATISSRSTYAGTDTPGTTTLLDRLTAARAGYLDTLNGIVAAIWAAVVDSAGITTLLSRLTSGRATALDHLDVDVSTRLADADYTAPDNAGIAAIEEKTDLLGAGVVVYGGPVLAAGRVEIIAGDDYLDADSRALSWTSEDWPDLTDATIALEIRQTTRPHGTESYEGEAVSATEVKVDLTADDTEGLNAGTWSFALKAELASDSEVTLAEGIFIVKVAP